LPKNSEEEKKARSEAIQAATKNAIEVPLRVMQLSYDSFEIIEAMAKDGNQNSVSDAGVGALCARSAVLGAYLNVKINAGGLKDESLKKNFLDKANDLRSKAISREEAILKVVESKMNG
jgi:glutamate formiminotransferase/formiminotetrahydrofolate cyclodeaminase